MPVIDAHQHFWRLSAPWHCWPGADLPAIHRDFGPDDLSPVLRCNGVDGTVLVQSQPDDADTDWMLDLAARTPDVLGVVGWADLAAPGARRRVAALAARPKLVGLRPMLQDLPPDCLIRPAAADGLAAVADHGLVLDALVRPAHLATVAEVAARHPALAVVIDHLAKPDIAGQALHHWADDMVRAAASPNVSCKLSGLVTEAGAGWTPVELEPFVAHALNTFGPERLLWGSDWPVVLLRADYERWLDVARLLVPAAHHGSVFGGNAVRIYGLDLPDRT